jgi:ankyrin repeat protein
MGQTYNQDLLLNKYMIKGSLMNKRLISKKVIALLYLTSLASSIANDKPQVTTIINGTDSSLNVDLTVPARAEALIRIRKIQVKFSQDILHKAILNNSIEEIRKAILAGADVNYIKDGKNPLFLAVALAQTNIVELLLENGAKPDEKLIQYAINLNDIRSAYLIAKKCGISFNSKWRCDIW